MAVGDSGCRDDWATDRASSYLRASIGEGGLGGWSSFDGFPRACSVATRGMQEAMPPLNWSGLQDRCGRRPAPFQREDQFLERCARLAVWC